MKTLILLVLIGLGVAEKLDHLVGHRGTATHGGRRVFRVSRPVQRHQAPAPKPSFTPFAVTRGQDLLTRNQQVLLPIATPHQAPQPKQQSFHQAPLKQQSFQAPRSKLDTGKDYPVILLQDQKYNLDGSYQHEFETEDGIKFRESGVSYPGKDFETGSYVKEGVIDYTLDDGRRVYYTYIADENGFQIIDDKGIKEVLPTPPATEHPLPHVPGVGDFKAVPLSQSAKF